MDSRPTLIIDLTPNVTKDYEAKLTNELDIAIFDRPAPKGPEESREPVTANTYSRKANRFPTTAVETHQARCDKCDMTFVNHYNN